MIPRNTEAGAHSQHELATILRSIADSIDRGERVRFPMIFIAAIHDTDPLSNIKDKHEDGVSIPLYTSGTDDQYWRFLRILAQVGEGKVPDNPEGGKVTGGYVPLKKPN